MIHLHPILGVHVPPGYRWAAKSPTETVVTRTRREARALAAAMPNARVIERREHWRPGCWRHGDA